MIPFLVQSAEKPADDDQLVSSLEEGGEDQLKDPGAGPFHTRCGHPRRRDD